jgi:hypothetical protein
MRRPGGIRRGTAPRQFRGYRMDRRRGRATAARIAVLGVLASLLTALPVASSATTPARAAASCPAGGCAVTVNLPAGRYLITVRSLDHKMWGSYITLPDDAAADGSLTQRIDLTEASADHPLPAGKLRIFVFEDNAWTNGAPDTEEAAANQGLGGPRPGWSCLRTGDRRRGCAASAAQAAGGSRRQFGRGRGHRRANAGRGRPARGGSRWRPEAGPGGARSAHRDAVGILWLAREAALIALVAVILGIRPRLGEPPTRRSTVWPVSAAALVLAVAWIEALGSHSVAVQSARAVAVAAYSLHVLTALLWLGALPALVLVLFPRVAGLPPRELVRACRGPFSASS